MHSDELINGLMVFFGILAVIFGLYSVVVATATLLEYIFEGSAINMWVLWSAIPASWLSMFTGWLSYRLDDK